MIRLYRTKDTNLKIVEVAAVKATDDWVYLPARACDPEGTLKRVKRDTLTTRFHNSLAAAQYYLIRCLEIRRNRVQKHVDQINDDIAAVKAKRKPDYSYDAALQNPEALSSGE